MGLFYLILTLASNLSTLRDVAKRSYNGSSVRFWYLGSMICDLGRLWPVRGISKCPEGLRMTNCGVLHHLGWLIIYWSRPVCQVQARVYYDTVQREPCVSEGLVPDARWVLNMAFYIAQAP